MKDLMNIKVFLVVVLFLALPSTAPVKVHASGPTLTANPSYVITPADSERTVTIQASGFSGTVNLTVSCSSGWGCTLSPTQISPNGTAYLYIHSKDQCFDAGDIAQVIGTSGSQKAGVIVNGKTIDCF